MKILYAGRFNGDNIYTGPEKVADRIFNLAAGEFETAFITYFFDGKINNIFKKLFGYDDIKPDSNNKIFRLGIFSVLKFSVKFKPDIIHIITFERFAVIFYLLKLFFKVKIIYTVHGIVKYENSVNSYATGTFKLKDSFCENIFFRYSDEIIFLSEISKKTAMIYYNISNKKTSIIPNGTDKIFHLCGLQKIYNDRSILRLVFAGEISKTEKGFSELITALEDINFKFELYAVSSEPSVKSTLIRIQNNSNVIFHLIPKMRTDIFAEFLQDKDIFISASSYEQFSIAAVESMAAGVVPIVSNKTGMSTYIRNNHNGFIFSEFNELTEIISKLNSDRMTLNTISRNSVLIYNDLNWENIFLKYKTLYN